MASELSNNKKSIETPPIQKRSQKYELHLNDRTQLQRLSGPVSYYYLKPTTEAFEKYKKTGLDLPLLFLFGDIHREESNLCNKCIEDDKCMGIEDRPFLEAIDSFAKGTPIDFYTEYSPYLSDISTNGMGILFDRFSKKVTSICHKTPLRTSNEYTLQCPTSLLRWHYGDIRYMHYYTEGICTLVKLYLNHFSNETNKNMFQSYSSFIYNQINIPNESNSIRYHDRLVDFTNVYLMEILNMSEFKDSLAKMRAAIYNEVLYEIADISNDKEINTSHYLNTTGGVNGNIVVIQRKVLTYLQENSLDLLPYQHTFIFYIHERAKKNDISFENEEKTDANTITYINELFEYTMQVITAIIRYIRRVSTWFFSSLTTYSDTLKSGLLKQIQKQYVPEFRSVDYWKEEYVRLFIENGGMGQFTKALLILVSIYMKIKKFDRTQEIIYSQIEPIFQSKSVYIPSKGTNTILFNLYSSISHAIGIPLTDLYVILRMMKKPENGVSGTIVFGFFGNAHTISLVDYFIRVGYDLVSYKEVQYGYANRCLSFNKNIYLEKDIIEHHNKRFHNSTNQRPSNYLSKITNEQNKRKTHRKNQSTNSLYKVHLGNSKSKHVPFFANNTTEARRMNTYSTRRNNHNKQKH